MRIIEGRHAIELAELLSLHSLAAQGKPKAIKEQISRWLKRAGR